MTARSYVETALLVLLVVVAVILLIGGAFGQPILLSYVETDSMEPTIGAGDGFVAVPAEVAGPVEEGDVIVFEAEQVHGGEMTTHRVVEVTDHGYVTKGDDNPFTDQGGGEPHVTDGQVVAKAWQFNGEVVVIPNLGTAAMTLEKTVSTVQFRLAAALGISALFEMQWITALLFAGGLVALLLGLLTGGDRSRVRSRSRSRAGVYNAGLVVALVAVLVFATAAGVMLATGGTQEYGIVSAEFDSNAPQTIPAGETEHRTLTVRNDGLLPTYVVMEPASSGVAVEPESQYVGQRSEANVTVGITAPPETGYYIRSVSEYHYFAVLPKPATVALHSVHPWLAIAAISGTIGGVFAVPLLLAFGAGTVRTRGGRSRRTIFGGRKHD